MILKDFEENFLILFLFFNKLGLNFFFILKNSLLQNNLALKCQIVQKKIILKLTKTGFVANDNWGQVPGFDLLHHI